MFITKMSLPRRRFLQGVGTAFALPFLDAMVPAATALANTAATARRFGAVFVPMGAVMDKWTPHATGAGFEFTPILKPLEPFRDHLVVVSGTNEPSEGTHSRSVSAFLLRLGPQAHGSRRRPGRHDHRSDHRREDRRGYPVQLARSGDRGRHRVHRRLRHGLQLRLSEHDVVEDADDAAADGDQSARGLRATVRPAGHARSASRPSSSRRQHPGFGAGRCGRAQSRAGAARQGRA